MASIRSIVSDLLSRGITPNLANVTESCQQAGIRPPGSPASLMATISQIRRDLGLTRAGGSGAIPTHHDDHHHDDHHHDSHHDDSHHDDSHHHEPCDRLFAPPKSDPSFITAPHYKAVMNAAHQMALMGENPLLLMTGPAGTGKTSFAKELAARTGRSYYEVSIPNFREGRQLLGEKTLNDEMRPIWQESQLVKIMRRGKSVICLDETNRCHPSLANILLPLLDHRRGTFFEEVQREISVAPGTIWVGTANLGREYSGSFALDKALRDRFATVIEVDYLPAKEEASLLVQRVRGLSKTDANGLVSVANATRKNATAEGANALSGAISTRQLLNAAKFLVTGGKATLIATIANHYPNTGSGSERERVLALLTGKFGNFMAEESAPAAAAPAPEKTGE